MYIEPYDTIIPNPNFDGVSLYICNASGRNGYSSGACVIMCHKDIKKNFIALNLGVRKINAGASSDVMAYALSFNGDILTNFANIILTPSLDSLDESGDPIYDYVDIREFPINISTIKSIYYCQVTF